VTLFLLHLRLHQQAWAIRNSIINTISKHNVKTADIGGSHTTTEFMNQVVEEIQNQTPEVG
jgi:isocitrate/isopropylmalate dehydrogenase